MKKIFVMLMLISILTIVGCETTRVVPAIDAEKQQSEETKRLLNEVNYQIGLPDITNFYEKKMAKEIFELRDDSKLVTYAYTQNLEGRYVFLGQCLGFGLPYSVQYTNPDKVIKTNIDYSAGGGANKEATDVIAQADPNGLYMPEGLSATWLMYVNSDTGEREVIYMEPEIIVTQSKLPKRLLADWSIPKDY